MANDYIIQTVDAEKLKVFQADKAQIDAQVATANMYPRNVKRIIEECITYATMDEETAASCIFTLPKGGKNITGPSVNLAKLIMQNWGHVRAQNKIVDINDKYIVSEAIFWDMQKNIAMSTQVQRLIVGRSGRYNDDMITVTGNAANSISLRNAAFAVIPQQVINVILKAAKKKIAGDLSTEEKLVNARNVMFKGLIETYNVTEAEILKAIGKNSISNITSDDIITLKGFASSLASSEITVDNLFRPDKKKEEDNIDKAEERVILLIKKCMNIQDLEKFKPNATTAKSSEAYDAKLKELSTKK